MIAMNEETNRKQEFRRNPLLEVLLADLNKWLTCSEQNVLQQKRLREHEEYPVVFIMGPHRSGTTLFLQWLANTGVIAYPTNLLSRFYGAPLIGAHIQMLLTDPQFNFRDELQEFSGAVSYESENGKTRGALAPNEFWYFWRRFLPFRDLDWLPDEDLMRVVDRTTFVRELAGLAMVFGKPFALKGMILNYNIPFLDAIFKKALFIQIKRDPVTNVASILDARKRQLGSEKEWYSFKIPEYPKLLGLDPIQQSAGQLYYINRAVSLGMSKIAENRRLVVQYEEFCENPRAVFSQILGKLQLEGANCYAGPARFRLSRTPDLPNRSVIEAALLTFKDQS